MKPRRLIAALFVILPFAPHAALATAAVESGPGAQSATQHEVPAGDGWFDKKPQSQPPQEQASPKPAPADTSASAKSRPVPASAKGTSAAAAQPSSSPKSVTAQPKMAPAEANDGQWVYTQQYGWVWLRYERESTYITPESYAYSYVYYPGNGWCWLYSPWVYGWGPAPYWGVRGRRYFVWYAHPWFTRPAGPPRAAPRGGIRSGAHWGSGFHGGFRGGVRGRR